MISQLSKIKNKSNLKNQEEQHLWISQAKYLFLQKEILLKRKVNQNRYQMQALSHQVSQVRDNNK